MYIVQASLAELRSRRYLGLGEGIASWCVPRKPVLLKPYLNRDYSGILLKYRFKAARLEQGLTVCIFQAAPYCWSADHILSNKVQHFSSCLCPLHWGSTAPLSEAGGAWFSKLPPWTTFYTHWFCFSWKSYLIQQVHSPLPPGDTSGKSNTQRLLGVSIQSAVGDREIAQLPGIEPVRILSPLAAALPRFGQWWLKAHVST